MKPFLLRSLILIQGHKSLFPLHARNMHYVFALAISLLFFFLIFSIISLTLYISLVIFSEIVFLCVGFYLSRIKHRYKTGFVFFQIGAFILLPLGFFASEGIDGPVIYVFFITLLIHFIGNPTGNIRGFLIANSLVLTICIAVNFFFPQFTLTAYTGRTYRYLDFMVTCLFTLFFFAFIFSTVRKAFLKNKMIIETNSKRIIHQHTQLEKALADKEQLLSIIAHDLHGPLNSIRDYLALLQKTKLESKSRILLEEKLKNLTKGASAMLNDLMEWRKEKSTVTEIKAVSLKHAIESVLTTLFERAIRKQIQINLPSDLNRHYVRADVSILQIVIRNILDNAIKFTGKGGKIKLNVRYAGASTILHIHDNGMGMSQQTLDNLFRQVLVSKKGTLGEVGSGMGLYVSKDLMSLMRGDIQVNSKMGAGSEFRLILRTAQ